MRNFFKCTHDLLLFVSALVLYPVDLVLFIPITAVLGDGDSYTRKFGANEWADLTSVMFHSEGAEKKPLLCSSVSAGALFGVIHCFAWHFAFPSYVEQGMWRVASLTVVGSCLWTFLATFIVPTLEYSDISSVAFKQVFDYLMRLATLLTICFSFLSLFLYPISRICLLVLALTALRSLPPSAFDTVRWLELVPHI